MDTIRHQTQFEDEAVLDADLTTFREDLWQAADLAVRLYERTRVTPATSRAEIASLFDESSSAHTA